ncbi:VOC family protein [Lacisediminimonas profundi]|uniref:VOC family protein n=1 Tax=Lacisediminimonas profundi TaxID=2603856 RepID=UPI00124B04E2|nr:VOC family protein [Lacisediminimonas profundi]
MPTQIYVNLPVRNLEQTRAFFSSLGFGFNPEFSNDQALAMVVSDNITVMLLVEDFFRTFTRKTIVDAHKSTEVLLALECENREEVDSMVAKAVAAGGMIARQPEDLGFMYSHSFEDLDGHIWEPFVMSGPPQ